MRDLSLASGTLPEWDPVTVIRAAAAAGFARCGIWYDSASWSASLTRAVAREFRDTGLRPLEIEVIVLERGAQPTAHRHLLDAGAAIGASDAIVVSREGDVGRCADLLAVLNEHAAAAGVHLCLEFLPIFAIRSLAQACAVLDRVGDPNVKLLVDPLHLARCGSEPADLRHLAPSLFSFAQFCDAKENAPADGGFDALYDEALNGRQLPGDGQLPLAGLLKELPPGLPLSLELRAGWLRTEYPDPIMRAGVVLRSTRRWLQAFGEISDR